MSVHPLPDGRLFVKNHESGTGIMHRDKSSAVAEMRNDLPTLEIKNLDEAISGVRPGGQYPRRYNVSLGHNRGTK